MISYGTVTVAIAIVGLLAFVGFILLMIGNFKDEIQARYMYCHNDHSKRGGGVYQVIGTFCFLAVFIMLANLGVGSFESSKRYIDPIEVYRGNTVLRITEEIDPSGGEVILDSVVVRKRNLEKKEGH